MSYILNLLLALVLLHLKFAGAWTVCWTCVSRDRIVSPAFGIELTPSYSTAAVRHHNGSVASLIKIDTLPDFKDLLRELDTSSASHHGLFENQIPLVTQSLIEQLVYFISFELSRVQDAVFNRYGIEIDRAAIVLPRLGSLEHWIIPEILANASMLAGIRDVFATYPYSMYPDLVGFAAAGMGLGLCEDYVELDRCAAEEMRLPEKMVYGVEFTNVSLRFGLASFQASESAFEWAWRWRWDLGLDAREEMGGQRWSGLVEDALKEMLDWSQGDFTDLILMGEAALDRGFIKALRRALGENVPKGFEHWERPTVKTWDGSELDLTFTASLGAAEIAKRVMESPDGCLEQPYCKLWRCLIG
ncbi:MAG: hypothetical protein M1820_008224 [Bogoriella megaspora]|nr:MAG: hypothetical protein M1820_008224 [Bogoriella megaspora]